MYFFGLLSIGLAAVLGTSTAFAQCEGPQIFASDAVAIDVLGWCVDIEGDVMAVGAIGVDDACPGNPTCNSGALYIFERTSGVWGESQQITAAGIQLEDEFGNDVSISGDRMIVGAHKQDTGKAYILRKVGGTWVEEQMLSGSSTATGFHFGHSVCLDGDTALVGTMRDNHAGIQSGSAYLFERVAGIWTESTNLKASNAAGGDLYGRASDLNGDLAIIGAHLHDTAPASDEGAAYIYERDSNGTPLDPLDDIWNETLLLPADPVLGGFFGRSVAISGDRAIVGSSFAQSGASQPGAVYVFERIGGVWTQVDKLIASDGNDADGFGISLSLDGDLLMVGARHNDETAMNAGAVYVFEHTGSAWVETSKVLASTGAANDGLADETGLAVSGDTLVVTSRFHTGPALLAGTVYTFDLTDCLGETYCPAVANSSGLVGKCTVSGSQIIGNDDLILTASQLPPGEFGMFLGSLTAGQSQLGGFTGILCLAGDIGRFNQSGLIGTGPVWSITVDMNSIPVNPAQPVLPGDTWHFQFWHRDVGNDTNMTEAARVTFH
jgi:hypothetical protein